MFDYSTSFWIDKVNVPHDEHLESGPQRIPCWRHDSIGGYCTRNKVNKMAIWKEMLVIHGKYHMLPYFLEIKKRFLLVYIMLHPESFVFVQAAMFRELPLFVGQRHVWIHLGCFYAYLLSFGELSPHVLWFDLLLPGNWFYQLVKEHSAIPMWSLAEFNKSDKSYAHFSVFSWSDTFLFTYIYIYKHMISNAISWKINILFRFAGYSSEESILHTVQRQLFLY